MSQKTRELQASVMAKIITSIESGVVPWRQSWQSDLPRNAVTGHRYRGSNVLMLWCTQLEHHYADQLWATYKQWGGAGAHVKKGEKGTPIVYYKRTVKQDEASGDPIRMSMYRLSWVFNIAQVEDVPMNLQPKPAHFFVAPQQKYDAAQQLIALHNIEFLEGEPAYVKSTDQIFMPLPAKFQTMDDYYRTAFHELGHWTGAKHRLDRDTLLRREAMTDKAIEELTAELCSAFIAARLGLEQGTEDNAATYIAGWLSKIKDQPAALFHAAAQAAKAQTFIMPDQLTEAEDLQEAA